MYVPAKKTPPLAGGMLNAASISSTPYCAAQGAYVRRCGPACSAQQVRARKVRACGASMEACSVRQAPLGTHVDAAVAGQVRARPVGALAGHAAVAGRGARRLRQRHDHAGVARRMAGQRHAQLNLARQHWRGAAAGRVRWSSGYAAEERGRLRAGRTGGAGLRVGGAHGAGLGAVVKRGGQDGLPARQVQVGVLRVTTKQRGVRAAARAV